MATYKKSELTKEKITKTAARLFAEKGYKSTTIREICAASGLSQSRVNYHFAGKEELASDILQLTLVEIDRSIKDRIPQEKQQSCEAAAVYIRLWLGAFLAQAKYVRFCADLADEGVFSKPIYEVFERLFESVNASQGLDLPPEELRVNGYVYVSALSSLIQSKHEGMWTRSNDAFCDTFVELFFKLLYVPKQEIKRLSELSLQKSKELQQEFEGKR